MRFSATVTLQYDTPFSPYPAREYEDALIWLKKSGFDGAEICISDYCNLDIKQISKQLQAHQLDCSTISTGQARGRENISLLQEGEGKQIAIHRLKEHIDAAALLGSKVTLGLLRGRAADTEGKKRLADSLTDVLIYAQKKNVVILIEAINRYETNVLNTAWETRDFIENQLEGNPNVGILWDTFHANIEDARLEETISVMGNRLKHVHMADSNRMFPGYGHLDFEEIFQLLNDFGYEEYCSFECLNLPDIMTVRQNAEPFISWARQIGYVQAQTHSSNKKRD